jgi:protein-disulfide isomerase
MIPMTTEEQNPSFPLTSINSRLMAAFFWTLVLCLFPNPVPAGTLPLKPDQPRQADTGLAAAALDDAALKAGIAFRLQTARGGKDTRFQQITADHVTIMQKLPVQTGPLTVFAVKLKIAPPAPDLPPEFITLVVDQTGTLQFGGIQELATGTDPAKQAMELLQAVDVNDLPAGFGKPVYTGTGPHTIIMISDPFCPHCRRGWEFVKVNLDRLHSLRLAHFPLSPAAETAALVMADAYHREFKVFDIIDFTYTRLDSSRDSLEILAQYMDEFPETAAHWGPTPEDAHTYLKKKFLAGIQSEQRAIQTLGIHSTPVFFVNQTFIKGFNEQKMEAAMP